MEDFIHSMMWVWLRVDNGFEISTNSWIKQGFVAEIPQLFVAPFGNLAASTQDR